MRRNVAARIGRKNLKSLSDFLRTHAGDHFIPRRDGLRDGRSLVPALQRNRGTELPADGAGDSVDDHVAPIGHAARGATDFSFGAAGAESLSHDLEQARCMAPLRGSVRNRMDSVNTFRARLGIPDRFTQAPSGQRFLNGRGWTPWGTESLRVGSAVFRVHFVGVVAHGVRE